MRTGGAWVGNKLGNQHILVTAGALCQTRGPGPGPRPSGLTPPHRQRTATPLGAARLAAERRNADAKEEAAQDWLEARRLLESPAAAGRSNRRPRCRGARAGELKAPAMELLQREASVAAVAVAAEDEDEGEGEGEGWPEIQSKVDALMLLRSVLGRQRVAPSRPGRASGAVAAAGSPRRRR